MNCCAASHLALPCAPICREASADTTWPILDIFIISVEVNFKCYEIVKYLCLKICNRLWLRFRGGIEMCILLLWSIYFAVLLHSCNVEAGWGNCWVTMGIESPEHHSCIVCIQCVSNQRHCVFGCSLTCCCVLCCTVVLSSCHVVVPLRILIYSSFFSDGMCEFCLTVSFKSHFWCCWPACID